MTWKERRIITILTTIVLILAAALLIVLGIRFREWRSDGDAGSGSASAGTMTDAGAYTSLVYDNGTTTLSFAQNDAGTWTWTGDDTFPLDDTVIQQILDLLVNWAPQQTLTDEKALESSGLSEPTALLTAASDGGTVSWRFIGANVTDDPTVRSLLEDVTALRVAKCVDYNPS